MDEFVAAPCSDVVAELGEGVIWDHTREELLWVDVHAGALHRARWDGQTLDYVGRIRVDVPLGAVAPAEDGGWVVAAGAGFARLREDGSLSWLSQPEGEQPGLRMNDGACDPAGRFWAGSMAYDEAPGVGTLYRLDPDGTTVAMLVGTTISNGIGWSVDQGTMWFSDSGPATVDAFDFGASDGALSGRRTVVDFEPARGVPDGLTVDAEDHVWVAMWDGGEVRRYSPTGDLVARVDLPVSRPTSCCFGGPDLATLFISTARIGLSDDQLLREPEAGRLFSLDTGVRGLRQPSFSSSR
jgi:sugar lactone lactonase YvrE